MTELGTTCVQGGYHPGDAEPRRSYLPVDHLEI